jgi:hypothetical protein
MGAMDVVLRFSSRDEAIEQAWRTAGYKVHAREAGQDKHGPRFNVSVCEVDDNEELVEALDKLLNERAEILSDYAREQAGRMQIDVGVNSDETDTLVKSIAFPIEQLRKLADLGISLCVSVYISPF